MDIRNTSPAPAPSKTFASLASGDLFAFESYHSGKPFDPSHVYVKVGNNQYVRLLNGASWIGADSCTQGAKVVSLKGKLTVEW